MLAADSATTGTDVNVNMGIAMDEKLLKEINNTVIQPLVQKLPTYQVSIALNALGTNCFR